MNGEFMTNERFQEIETEKTGMCRVCKEWADVITIVDTWFDEKDVEVSNCCYAGFVDETIQGG
jgi:hypothetical protein